MAEQAGNVEKLKGLREDYKKTFSTEEGKRVLNDLAYRCYYNTTTFVPKDEHSTMLNEGARCLFLHIKTMVEMDIEQLEKLADAVR